MVSVVTRAAMAAGAMAPAGIGDPHLVRARGNRDVIGQWEGLLGEMVAAGCAVTPTESA
jgi:hypothetical protein